jgi:hypothetical protein
MRYLRPQITGVYLAVSLIKSVKGTGHDELGTIFLTNGAAYQADE